jgi:flagellin
MTTVGVQATQSNALALAIATSVRRLSSGLRVSSAADDPSGVAIATNVATQAQGLDQGRRNVNDARNALTVADGALSTMASTLQRMRSLTVQARNDLVSTSDRQDINAEMQSLAREIDATAQAATFNGRPLFAAQTAPAPTGRVATISRDDVMANGQQFVDPASLYVNTGTGTDFTLTGKVLSYDAASNTVTVQFDATSDDGQSFFNAPFPHDHTYGANTGPAVWWINDASNSTRLITFTTPSIGAGDVGKQFSLSCALPAAAAAPTGTLSVATGGREGQSVDVSTDAVSAAALGVQDVTLGSDDAANRAAQQSVDEAIATVGAMRASLGAQTVSLGEESTDSANASLNLTASASSIVDVDVASESSSYAKLQTLQAMQSHVQSALRQEALALTGTLLDALR